MWKVFVICLFAGLVSCAGANNSHKAGEENASIQEIAAVCITGQWDIENVVENDSSYVRPSEIEQGITSYIDFRENNTFGVLTNCNHIGGQYQQDHNSIRLYEIMTTEMACDNMELEEMLKKVLPQVNTIDCINDSIMRLNSDKNESYIVLKKRATPVK